jgi:hypothetical protein
MEEQNQAATNKVTFYNRDLLDDFDRIVAHFRDQDYTLLLHVERSVCRQCTFGRLTLRCSRSLFDQLQNKKKIRILSRHAKTRPVYVTQAFRDDLKSMAVLGQYAEAVL